MPLHRLTLLVPSVILLLGAAVASPRDDVLEALGRCAAIADNQSRLACYDQLAPNLKQAIATPPGSLDHEPTKTEQESWFGFDIGSLFGGGSSAPTSPDQFGRERTAESQAIRRREEIESISAKVTEIAYTAFGQFIVFLDNGQVWRQLQGEAERARFRSEPKANTVTISRGALGSYNLTLNDSSKIFKVTRVK